MSNMKYLKKFEYQNFDKVKKSGKILSNLEAGMPVRWKDSMGNWKQGKFYEYIYNINKRIKSSEWMAVRFGANNDSYKVGVTHQLGDKNYRSTEFISFDNDTFELDQLEIDSDKYKM